MEAHSDLDSSGLWRTRGATPAARRDVGDRPVVWRPVAVEALPRRLTHPPASRPQGSSWGLLGCKATVFAQRSRAMHREE